MSDETPATLPVESLTNADPNDVPSNAARTVRAATEPMFVVPVPDAETDTATGLYHLITGSGSTYTVDLEAGRHTCPDTEYRGDTYTGGCKHERRVVMAVHRGAVPAPGEPISDAYYERLSRALATAAVVAKRDLDEDLWRAVQAAEREAETQLDAQRVEVA